MELTTHCLKDTFEMVDILESTDFPESVMCSFDVESLFTNVPLEETANFLCDYISNTGIDFPIPVNILKKLILICTKNIKFHFQGTGYRQIDGVAMGSPLGPTLADVFMAKIEQDASHRINELLLYKRYLDDILIVAHNREQIKSLFDFLNTLHPSIKFTCEFENNRSLAFLDILMTKRADGSISRSVYRKATWTGQYQNFLSFCPIQYKRGLVRTLFYRARKICTSDTLEQELQLLTETLKANNYPQKFIEANSKPRILAEPVQTVDKKCVFLRLPYTGEIISNTVRRTINAAIKRTYRAAQLKMTFTTRNIPLPPIKSSLPVLSTSNCIYSFTCSCGEAYIGRTERRLLTRVKEHIPSYLLHGFTQAGNRNPASSIAKHVLQTGHPVSIESSFKIVTTSNRPHMLKFLEALFIMRHKPTLCAQKDLRVTLNLPWFPRLG